MKKNWIYFLLFMAIATMPLTSCDKDDDDIKTEQQQHDPESDADQTALAGYDALEYLQGSLVVVDEETGEIVRRVYGEALDESQPTVISVPVSDLADAEEIFIGWVAPDKVATKVEGGYDYNLTDAVGNAQGSVSFRAVEGETGVVARMTVAEGTSLKMVSEVKFIDAEFWPENAKPKKYIEGEIYDYEIKIYTWEEKENSISGTYYRPSYVKSYEHFYCVRGNTDGKDAILIWMSPEEEAKHAAPGYYVLFGSTVYDNLPTVAEAEKVLECFNNHKVAWERMLDIAENNGYNWKAKWSFFGSTTNNYEYILNSYDRNNKKIKCLDLDSRPGKICDVEVHPAKNFNHYRYLYVRIIPAIKW